MIWRLFDSPSSAREIAAVLVDAFASADPEAVRGDVGRLIGALAAEGLLLEEKG